MIKKTFYSISILVCLPATLSVSAQVRLEPEMVNEEIDGMVSSYLALSGNEFSGRYFGDGNWLISDNLRKGSSISFDHRYVESIRMDLGVYNTNAFLTDYGEDAIKEYATSMIEKFSTKGLIAKKVSAEKSTLGGESFMGRAYWHVRVEFNSSQTGLPSMYVSDFLSVGQNGRNYRLRFTGDPEEFSRLESKFESVLGRFMVDY